MQRTMITLGMKRRVIIDGEPVDLGPLPCPGMAGRCALRNVYAGRVSRHIGESEDEGSTATSPNQ